MISPTPKDIGREVTLPIFGAPPMRGKLVEVLMADMLNSEPFAMVKFPDLRQAVATAISKLEWAK